MSITADDIEPFEQLIERMLRFLETGFNKDAVHAYASPYGQYLTDYVPMEHFDGAEPLFTEALEETRILESMPDERKFFADVTPHDIGHRLSVSTISAPDPDDPDSSLSHLPSLKIKDHPLILQRFRFIKPSEVRGRVRMVVPTIMEHTVATALPERGYHSFRRYSGLYQGQWHEIDRKDGKVIPHAPEDARTFQVAMSLQFTRRYEWRVLLGYSPGRRLGFPTDPVGVREVFKLRDVPEGKKRRAALRHWVTKHLRRRRNDPEAATWVREHMRGVVKFTWNDMLGEIHPSAFDRERNREVVNETETKAET